MKLESFAATDIGRHRDGNEDCYAIDEAFGMFSVCDGMGGHAAGEIASRKAVEFAAEHIRQNQAIVRRAASTPGGYYRVLELAEDALQMSSEKLYRLACEQSDLAGMGTTLTMLLLLDDKAIMSHVGDSRLYLHRDEEVHQLSSDHTLAHDLVLAGALSDEEAKQSRARHMLTRTIGQQERVQVESLLFDAFPGDTFLLCSDGLSNYIEDEQQLAPFLAGEDISESPTKLVELANQCGGRDNITAVIVRVTEDRQSPVVDPGALKDCLDVLRSSKLFRGLPLNRLMRIADIGSLSPWRSGEDVITNGQTLQGMFFVLKGNLAIRGDESRSHLGSGDSFGEPALLFPHECPVTITAQEDSQTMFIPGARFEELTRRQPKLGRRLFRRLAGLLSQQLVRVTEDLVDMSQVDTWVERD